MSTGDPITIGTFHTAIAPNNWDYITSSYIEPNYGIQKEMTEMKEKIEAIEDRLAILRPDETLHEKYPALKEAYEHYKLIEKLVKDQNKK